MARSTAAGAQRRAVVERRAVWGRFVRLFHWSLAASVVLAWGVLEAGEDPHQWAGYTAAGLVAARLVWGLIGPAHARLRDLVPTPSRFAALRGPRRAWVGHNPVGGAMVLWLMTLVLAMGASGWLMGTDRYWGEEWLENLHETLGNVLAASVVLHVTGVIATSLKIGINLPAAMITGVKVRRAGSAPFVEPAERDRQSD